MKDFTTNDIRKAAFAVGFGFVVGKKFGILVNSAIDGTVRGVVKALASNGNKFAQKVLDEVNIKYEVKNDKTR